LGAAALALLAAGIYWQFYRPSRYVLPSSGAALAVVPFECLCTSLEGARFSAGFTDVLAADLSRAGGIQVTAPSTVRRHQKAGVSMGLMGRLLGLDVLVEGAVQTLPDRLRITARLVDVHTGKMIWADTYDEAAADPAQAQDAAAGQAAAQIAQALRHK